MEIILQIPAQRATQNIPRQMTVTGIDFQNGVLAEARDAKLPGTLRFTEHDDFPWDQFLQKLAVLWQLSQNGNIPPAFRLKKKLPTGISENIPSLTSRDSLRLLEKLGALGFISAFSKLGK